MKIVNQRFIFYLITFSSGFIAGINADNYKFLFHSIISAIVLRIIVSLLMSLADKIKKKYDLTNTKKADRLLSLFKD